VALPVVPATLVLLLSGCATSRAASRPPGPAASTSTTPIAPGPTAPAPPTTAPGDPGGVYLALGDSVAFGYRPPSVTPPLAYFDASTFVGYPEDVAGALGLAGTNAACPGETTASMILASARSNGCENTVTSSIGYRTFFPLHAAYRGSQLDFAVQFLRSHPATRLVTLQIGANDAFVCQMTTADGCRGSDFAAMLAQLSRNLTAIYTAVRVTAGYEGPLVAVSYYATDYAIPAEVASTRALDAAMTGPSTRFRAVVADGYGAFKAASAPFGADPCTAGLLVALPTGGCDRHPTASGHLVLARAVEAAVRAGG
jgi:lysophospholipase L1-like esterase